MALSSVPFGVLKPLAYVDPGSGSVLLQLAIAAILGLGLIVRLQWARIKKWLGRKSPPDEDHEVDEE